MSDLDPRESVGRSWPVLIGLARVSGENEWASGGCIPEPVYLAMASCHMSWFDILTCIGSVDR